MEHLKLIGVIIWNSQRIHTPKTYSQVYKIIFPGFMLEYSKEIKKIFAKETATLLSHKNMRITFRDINITAVFKNKSGLKNLVVKQKYN